MPPPSRSKQIAAVAAFLDDRSNDMLTVKEVATKIVDGYHDLLQADLKPLISPLHTGLTFKSPFTAKVHHVGWTDGIQAWIITADSHFGWLGPVTAPVWSFFEESRAKAGAPGNNKDYQVGQMFSRNQRLKEYTVIATGDKCVLLRDNHNDSLTADSNTNIAKHYRLES